MTLRCICLAAALAMVVGCAPLDKSADTLAGFSLHAQPETVRAGQAVTLRLVNEHSPEQLGYNLCTSHLERRRDDGWEPIPSERICTMELRILAPGESARYEFDLPEQLESGSYRVVTTIFMLQADDRLEVTSNPLRVE